MDNIDLHKNEIFKIFNFVNIYSKFERTFSLGSNPRVIEVKMVQWEWPKQETKSNKISIESN